MALPYCWPVHGRAGRQYQDVKISDSRGRLLRYARLMLDAVLTDVGQERDLLLNLLLYAVVAELHGDVTTDKSMGGYVIILKEIIIYL